MRWHPFQTTNIFSSATGRHLSTVQFKSGMERAGLRAGDVLFTEREAQIGEAKRCIIRVGQTAVLPDFAIS